MKPLISFCITTGTLSSVSTSATAAARVSAEVCGPRTTSTHFITSAGLKKWMLITRSGRWVASAIRDGTKLEEFEARMVRSGHSASSRRKISCFTGRFSTAAR